MSTNYEVSASARPRITRQGLDTVSATGLARYTQIRVFHVIGSVLALVCVGATYLVLAKIPGLNYGWVDLFGGHGSIITGAGAAHTTAHGSGFPFGVFLTFLGASALLIFLPRLAESEERDFRFGGEFRSFSEHARSCLKFGLLHLVMGIPLSAALALSIGGAWFSLNYLRGFDRFVSTPATLELPPKGAGESARAAFSRDSDLRIHLAAARAGVAESTRAHLAYNALIVGGVWIGCLVTLLGHL